MPTGEISYLIQRKDLHKSVLNMTRHCFKSKKKTSLPPGDWVVPDQLFTGMPSIYFKTGLGVRMCRWTRRNNDLFTSSLEEGFLADLLDRYPFKLNPTEEEFYSMFKYEDIRYPESLGPYMEFIGKLTTFKERSQNEDDAEVHDPIGKD